MYIRTSYWLTNWKDTEKIPRGNDLELHDFYSQYLEQLIFLLISKKYI